MGTSIPVPAANRSESGQAGRGSGLPVQPVRTCMPSGSVVTSLGLVTIIFRDLEFYCASLD